MKKTIYWIAGLVTIFTLGLVNVADDPASARGPQLVAAFGKANLGGQEVIVHTVSLVPRGETPDQVAAASLAAQGARPITSAEFELTGLKMPDTNGDGVSDGIFSYNDAGAVLDPASTAEITNALYEWRQAGANLVIHDMGETTVCPSLVRECPGKQFGDGRNDVGWVAISGKNTLGVTWYLVGSQEADIAFDIDQDWYIGDGVDQASDDGIDIRTVAIHEFGHAFGLGHEESGDTVMNAYYGGEDWDIGADDIAGMLAVYNGIVPPPSGGDPTALTVADIDFVPSGPRGRDLVFEVHIDDDLGNNAEGATVNLSASHATWGSGNATASTNSDGIVRFRVRNAPAGEWTATVTSATSGDLSCNNCAYTETWTKP